jgi:hypothetical protein
MSDRSHKGPGRSHESSHDRLRPNHELDARHAQREKRAPELSTKQDVDVAARRIAELDAAIKKQQRVVTAVANGGGEGMDVAHSQLQALVTATKTEVETLKSTIRPDKLADNVRMQKAISDVQATMAWSAPKIRPPQATMRPWDPIGIKQVQLVQQAPVHDFTTTSVVAPPSTMLAPQATLIQSTAAAAPVTVDSQQEHKTLTTPQYMVKYDEELRSGMYRFLIAHPIATPANVQFAGNYHDVIFQLLEMCNGGGAHTLTALRRWLEPADALALMDAARGTVTSSTGHERGDGQWHESVAATMGNHLYQALHVSLDRMLRRMVAVQVKQWDHDDYAAVNPAKLLPSNRLDWDVARVITGHYKGVGRAEVALDTPPEVAREAVRSRTVTTMQWQDTVGGAINAIKPTSPADASAEEMSIALFGTTVAASRLRQVGDVFYVPPDLLRTARPQLPAIFTAASPVVSDAVVQDQVAQAATRSNQADVTAESNRASNAQQPAVHDVTDAQLQAAWQNIDDELTAMSALAPPLKLQTTMAELRSAHAVDQSWPGRGHDGGSMDAAQQQRRSAKLAQFASQAQVLSGVAAIIGQVADKLPSHRPVSGRSTPAAAAATASSVAQENVFAHAQLDVAIDAATQQLIDEAMTVARSSRLAQTVPSQLAALYTRVRERDQRAVQAQVQAAAKSSEQAAQSTPAQVAGQSQGAHNAFVDSNAIARSGALAEELADIQANLVTAQGAQAQALRARLQIIFTQARVLEQSTTLMSAAAVAQQVSATMEQLGDSVWAVLTSGTGKFARQRQAAHNLRAELLVSARRLSATLRAREAAVESGHAGAVDKADAAIEKELHHVQALGQVEATKEMLQRAHDTCDSVQTRTQIAMIAVMIGITLVTMGVGAFADGVVLGGEAVVGSEVGVAAVNGVEVIAASQTMMIGAGGEIMLTTQAARTGAALFKLSTEALAQSSLQSLVMGNPLASSMLENIAASFVSLGALHSLQSLASGVEAGLKARGATAWAAVLGSKGAVISVQLLGQIAADVGMGYARKYAATGHGLTEEEMADIAVHAAGMTIGCVLAHGLLSKQLAALRHMGSRFSADVATTTKLLFRAESLEKRGDPTAAQTLLHDVQQELHGQQARMHELAGKSSSQLAHLGVSAEAIRLLAADTNVAASAVGRASVEATAINGGMTAVGRGMYVGDAITVERAVAEYRTQGMIVDQGQAAPRAGGETTTDTAAPPRSYRVRSPDGSADIALVVRTAPEATIDGASTHGAAKTAAAATPTSNAAAKSTTTHEPASNHAPVPEPSTKSSGGPTSAGAVKEPHAQRIETVIGHGVTAIGRDSFVIAPHSLSELHSGWHGAHDAPASAIHYDSKTNRSHFEANVSCSKANRLRLRWSRALVAALTHLQTLMSALILWSESRFRLRMGRKLSAL